MKEIEAVAFEPTGKIYPVKLNPEDWFEKAKEMLGIETADIVTRKFKGYAFDILCDDEGLLVDKPIVSAVDKDGGVMLVGNLLLMHPRKIDEYGNDILESVTDEEEFALVCSVKLYMDKEKNMRAVLIGGEYDC